MIFERYCVMCKKYFTTANYKQKTHDIGCRIAYDRQKEKVYRHKRWLKDKAKAKTILTKNCIICHIPFNTNQADNEVICFQCRLNKKNTNG